MKLALTRFQAREAAVQMLFQMDQRGIPADESIVLFWESLAETAWDMFADQLVLGVGDHLAEVDAAIQTASQKWRIDRMASADRAVLRLGAYELLFTDTDRAIVLNEMVDLAKKFGGEDSPAFVNGLLDKIESK